MVGFSASLIAPPPAYIYLAGCSCTSAYFIAAHALLLTTACKGKAEGRGLAGGEELAEGLYWLVD